MRTLACDSNNDLYIGGDGRLVVLSGLPATAQCARTAVQAQRGEMIYAMDSGMPTKETAFDVLNPPQFEAAARSIIGAVPGVRSVDSFEMEQTDDKLRYRAVINTEYGTGGVNG